LNTLARSAAELHTAFLTILPRIQLHGHVYFRHRRPDRREEAVAEMVALAWKWFTRLAERGKDATAWPMALACFAARAVNHGRRLCGQEKSKDVLSPSAQQRHGFTVSPLPEPSSADDNLLVEALHDNTCTPPDEQAAFRLDFPAWRLTRSDRDRRVIDDLMVGERTMDVAAKRGLTAGRVSQLRRDFHEDWSRFCGLDERPQV
jgi:hypothetical protein